MLAVPHLARMSAGHLVAGGGAVALILAVPDLAGMSAQHFVAGGGAVACDGPCGFI